MEEEGTVLDITARKWFLKLSFGNADIEDTPRSGRPSTTDDEDLCQIVEDKPRSKRQ